MIGGVTRHILPHLFWGPPPPCKQALRLVKQQFYACITLLCTFLCHHCTTTTWKCLILLGGRDFLFSFLEVQCSLLEFNSRKQCQNLRNWRRWNRCDEVWSSATSLFEWCFRSRRRPFVAFKSSLIKRRQTPLGPRRSDFCHSDHYFLNFPPLIFGSQILGTTWPAAIRFFLEARERTWDRGWRYVSGTLDTSRKCIDREGLGGSCTGMRQNTGK